MCHLSLTPVLRTVVLVLFSLALSASPVGAATHLVHTHTMAKTWTQQMSHQGHVVPERVSTKTLHRSSSRGATRALYVRPGPASLHAVATPRKGAVQVQAPRHSSPHTTGYTSFDGRGFTGWHPSDSNADIGPNDVVEGVNEEWAIYDRNGNQQFTAKFTDWFGQASFDPKVLYDPLGQRFFLAVDTGSAIKISVARQTDALGKWCTYTFKIPNFPDYDQLGVDTNGIYFSANVYQSADQGAPFLYSLLYQLDRGAMEGCQTVNFWTWDHLMNADGSLSFAVVPAIKYNYLTNLNEEYLVNALLGGGCSLTLWKLSNLNLAGANVDTQCYKPGPSAPQKDSSGLIATGDNRLYQASYRDGLLDLATVTAYDWGSGKVDDVAAWFKMDVANNKIYQQGYFGNPEWWSFFPSIQQDSNGDAVVVYNSSGSSFYPNVWYNGLGADSSLRDTKALVSGQGYDGTSGTERWGDYESARLDTTNSTHIWICGQYARSDHKWGTAIGEVGA